MTYTYKLVGKTTIELPPAECSASDQFRSRATILEQVILKNRLIDLVTLTVDTPVAVSFGGLSTACVVSLRVTTTGSGKVLAALTHADGTAQLVPIDPLFILITQTSPVTAITLTRTATVEASVEVMLGELSV